MNIVGIIGGLGPESTVDYYQSIISKSGTGGRVETTEKVVFHKKTKDFRGA